MLRSHKYAYCVYTKESLVYTQEISCACTTLLCRALGQGTQGPGTQRGSWAGPRPWTAASLAPWPLGSLARSMHTTVVHAQEISCVYTRNSFVYTQQMYSHNIILYYYIIILYDYIIIILLYYYIILLYYYIIILYGYIILIILNHD